MNRSAHLIEFYRKWGKWQVNCTSQTGFVRKRSSEQLRFSTASAKRFHSRLKTYLPLLSTKSIPEPGRYTINEAHKELVLKELPVTAGHEPATGELLVDQAKISFPLLLRSFLPGEKFHPYGGPGSKKISRYFNDRKIPAKERSSWPVLLSEDKVVALVGLQLDNNFRITNNTSRILSILWRDRRLMDENIMIFS